MLPPFMRPGYLVPAAIGTALFAWLVPINHGPAGKAGVLFVVWMAFAFFAYSLRDLIELVREWRTPNAARASTAVVRTSVAMAPASPTLSAEDEAEVREIVELFTETGVFAPAAPTPAHLFEAAADQGSPVTQGTVLGALHEAHYYHPDFDEARCMANLAFHGSHNEQDEETLRRQISDIVRLSRGALQVRDVTIALPPIHGAAASHECAIQMTVNGAPTTMSYEHAAKYLSTHLHVALAMALRASVAAHQLAWLWDDQGVWLTALGDRDIEALNNGLGAASDDAAQWEWVDDAEPIAAGESIAR